MSLSCRLKNNKMLDYSEYPHIDLKPCPFCGNQNLFHGSTGASYEVICAHPTETSLTGCGARAKVIFPDNYPDGIDSYAGLQLYMYKEVAARWNQRV